MSKFLTGPRRYAELSSTTSQSTEPPVQQQNAYQPTASPFSHQQHQDHHQPATSPYSTQTKAQGQQFAFNQQATNPYEAQNQTTQYQNQTQDYSRQPARQPSATPVSDQKPRRRSSKTRQIDTDKIPRPDTNPESSYAPVTFVTSAINGPPPSYTNYITVDDGNAGPRYIRSTYYKFPTEESLANSTHVPLGLIIQPLADPSPDEEPVPVTDYGEAGPLRCNRCRGYVNPNWTFVQGGSTGVCNLCKMSNEIPKEYYSTLDENGLRRDRYEKPELNKGVYEFLAPSTYHTRPLVTSNIVFCIEASSTSYLSGILHQIFSSLQSLLDYLPSPELTKICIMTYDTGINFFKVPDDLTKEISIINIPDIDASCLPFPKNYLFLSLQEERDKINYLIERILKYYESSERMQKGVHSTCFGAALDDACDLLLQDGGRVLAFTTQAPIAGIGKIKRRDDLKLMGTDKERSLYVPQTEEYSNWGKKYLEKRISVDLFCFAPDYFDITTIGQVCGITGGNLYYYPTYKPGTDGERLHYDLARNLTRYVGYDAAMTIRTCQGIAFMDYITPIGRRPVPEIEFSSIDADSVFNVYLKHEEKITNDNVTFQVALLYTNPYGQRVIRVLNFKIITSNDLVTIFKSFDVETVAQLIIKRNINNLTTTAVPHIRKTMMELLVNILYSYRHHCASSSPPTQLILPEALKVLPVYFLATFKAHVLRMTGDTKPDDRAYDLFRFIKTPLNVLSNIFYVKMYPLHTIWTGEEYSPGDVIEGRTILGGNLAATDEKIDDNGIYLLDNGEILYLYVKKNVDPQFLPHLFGVETYQEVQALQSFPEYVESEYYTKVANIIDQLRKNKNSAYQAVKIVTEKDHSEQQLLNLLVEDERFGEAYSSFLVNMHKQIQEKLT